MKILALAGLSEKAIAILEASNFEVKQVKVAQQQLENYINANAFDAVIIGKSNEIHQDIIDNCSSLKLIASLNSNTDHIDVQYAEDHGIPIIFSQEGSANAIAELVFAHLFGMVRFLHQSNREMPLEGDTNFDLLHRNFVQGTELRGKTLGIIGFDKIGKEVAKLALGVGMKVVTTLNQTNDNMVNIPFYNGQFINIEVETDTFNEIIKQSDFITIHTEDSGAHILGSEAFDKVKKGVGIINVSHAGAIDELALVDAIRARKVQFAGLDTFENQPSPEIQLLMNPELSLTPNIASKTIEAKERVSVALANQIINLLS